MNIPEQKQILATILNYPKESNNALFVLGDLFPIIWDKQIHCQIAEEILRAKSAGVQTDYKYLLRNAPESLHKEVKSIKGNHEDPAILKDRCQELRNNYIKKDRSRYNLQLVELDKEPLTPAEYAEKRKLIKRPVPTGYVPNNSKTAASENLEKFIDRQNNPGITGIPTGFAELDKITQGLTTSTVHIIGARPSVGKTAIAGQITINVARQDIPVIFITHEMTENQIITRCCCSIAKTSLQMADIGKLNTKSTQRYIQANQDYNSLPITIYDPETINLSEIKSFCIDHGHNNPRKKQRGLIIVDYIQLEKIPNYKGSRTDEISEICAMWKEIARKTDYAILWLAQIGRPPKGKELEVARLSDLRDCGGLEQDAHTGIILSRKGHFSDEHPANVIDIDIQKNRDGCVGHTQVEFIGWCQRVQDINEDFQPLTRGIFTKTANNEANLQNKNIIDKPKKAKKEVKKVPTPENLKDNETF